MGLIEETLARAKRNMDALLLPPSIPELSLTFITKGFPSADGWNYYGGATEDTTDTPAFGTQSGKITTTAGNSGGPSIEKGGMALDLTGKALVVFIKKLTPYDGTGGFVAYFGTSNFSDYYSWNSVIPEEVETEWQAIVLPFTKAAVSGAPNRASLDHFKITSNASGVTSDVTHLVGALATVPHPTAYPNGVVSFTFDDSVANAMGGRNYMDAYGWGGTNYIIVSSQSTDDVANAHMLERYHGWEIGGHAYGQHIDPTTLSPGVFEADNRQLKRWLVEQGFKGQHNYAYPYGGNNTSVRETVRKYFQTARNVAHWERQSLPVMEAERVRLWAQNIAEGVAAVEAALDKAHSTPGWCILMCHTIYDTTTGSSNITPADFQTILAYIDSLGMAVEPVGKVMGQWS